MGVVVGMEVAVVEAMVVEVVVAMEVVVAAMEVAAVGEGVTAATSPSTPFPYVSAGFLGPNNVHRLTRRWNIFSDTDNYCIISNEWAICHMLMFGSEIWELGTLAVLSERLLV